MSSLFGSISISLRALLAQQGALQTTTANIANANTPGYARRRAVMTEEAPVFEAGLLIGRGVTISSVESVRDRILELRIQDETQQQGASEAYVGAMQSVETLIGNSDGIASQIDKFFNSITRLSTDPSDIPLRQAVLTAGSNLAGAFRDTARKLASIQQNLDLGVQQSIAEVNRVVEQIGGLNTQVAALEKLGQDGGALEDQRILLIRQLSTLIDVSIAESSDGLTLTTPGGQPLVVGSRTFTLETSPDPGTGMNRIIAGTADITPELHAGRLGGLLSARDKSIAELSAGLDTLAFSLAQRLNNEHQSGFDLNGDAGGALFSLPADEHGAASTIAFLITNSAKIAASSDASVGSNGNLANMSALRSEAIVGQATATDCYANLVFRVGSEVANGKAEAEASEMIVRQLDNQRGAISGVSMDEEAANLIRFQRAFEAAARVISVVNELTQTAVNLGRN
ncbi:MAG TPA: flagellar hook-associated protein FlgK [Clostridia bacterium]|nr:flagellar hook-associated protein FlgK [Clostridia bacterium]